MKSDAIIVNVGRGEVINEAELMAALKAKTIAGAALDVRAQEDAATVNILSLLPPLSVARSKAVLLRLCMPPAHAQEAVPNVCSVGYSPRVDAHAHHLMETLCRI